MTSTFVDLSSNNNVPNLAAYASTGRHWVFFKTSEGNHYHWVEGDNLCDQAHKLGLHVGHYHWLRPDSAPAEQAAYFVEMLGKHVFPGDVLVVDYERTSDAEDPDDEARAAQLVAFATHVREALPSLAILVYTGNWYLDNRPHMQQAVKRFPVQMSDYTGGAMPNPFGLHYVARQFTDREIVPGCVGPVDCNIWLVNPATLYPHPATGEDDVAWTDEFVNPINGEKAAAYSFLVNSYKFSLEALQAVQNLEKQVAELVTASQKPAPAVAAVEAPVPAEAPAAPAE